MGLSVGLSDTVGVSRGLGVWGCEVLSMAGVDPIYKRLKVNIGTLILRIGLGG